MRERAEPAAALLRARAGGPLDCAIVLGSGLAEALRPRIDGGAIAYEELGLPCPSVAGHRGEAQVGVLRGRRVVAFNGRFHLYEGHVAAAVVAPVALAAAAGASRIILTNAAGAVNPAYRPGDLMLIADQLNLTGASPLIGPEPLPGVATRFVDMGRAYAEELRALARRVAGEQGIALREGVFAGVLGPAYETPAEARYLRTIGADAVAMSTVLETIAARALGVDVLGISLITNVHGAAEPLRHEEVLATGARSADALALLVEGVVAELPCATRAR